MVSPFFCFLSTFLSSILTSEARRNSTTSGNTGKYIEYAINPESGIAKMNRSLGSGVITGKKVSVGPAHRSNIGSRKYVSWAGSNEVCDDPELRNVCANTGKFRSFSSYVSCPGVQNRLEQPKTRRKKVRHVPVGSHRSIHIAAIPRIRSWTRPHENSQERPRTSLQLVDVFYVIGLSVREAGFVFSLVLGREAAKIKISVLLE